MYFAISSFRVWSRYKFEHYLLFSYTPDSCYCSVGKKYTFFIPGTLIDLDKKALHWLIMLQLPAPCTVVSQSSCTYISMLDLMFSPGNVNGVNVIGLALQGPSVPSIAMLRASQEPIPGPYTLTSKAGSGNKRSTLLICTFQYPISAEHVDLGISFP